jgi:molybdenum cofactor cytidylyltransferase
MDHRFGVVILAAGASAHVKRPKQLLPFLGRTLVEHAARTALASGAAEVIVVIGFESDAIRQKLKGLPVRIVLNRQWKEGLASSIRAGIGVVSQKTERVVIALADQPRITPDLLRDLASRQKQTGIPVVASSYDGVIGAPTAFGAEMFPSLLALQGNRGARELIRCATVPVETIEFSGGNVELADQSDLRATSPPLKPEELQSGTRRGRDARAPPSLALTFLSPA